MKSQRLILLISILLLSFMSYGVSRSLFDDVEGSWVAKIRDSKVRLKLTIFEDDESWGEWSSSGSFERKDFQGLELNRESNFKLVREAGTISFSGIFKDSRGYGDFSFSPDNRFRSFLKEKGFDEVTDKKMLMLSLHDVSKQYVSDLAKIGFSDISISKLVSFAVHEISIDYIQDIRKAGFTDISPSKNNQLQSA